MTITVVCRAGSLSLYLPRPFQLSTKNGANCSYMRALAFVSYYGSSGWANIAEESKFSSIARYLENKGWIAKSTADYGVFMITAEGIEEATD
jgi:hypothetical protein